MNLYMINRTDEIGYDEYDAYIIAADTEEDALGLCCWEASIASPPMCKLIGTTIGDVERGSVLGSFCAG